MDTKIKTSNLTYTDHDGVNRAVEGISITQDKAGRWWMWSEQTQRNLAYMGKSERDCLVSAISSLLFSIQLRDECIAALQRIADLAQEFAEQVNPPEEH